MQNIRTIKIFLGSSITELHDERVVLGDYLTNSVRPILKQGGSEVEVIKWEDIRSGNTGKPPQKEIDKLLKGCDVSVFMFKSKAGDKTIHEFDVAKKLQNQKRKKHKIYVYCFAVPEADKSQELKDFQTRLKKEEFYWDTCKDITDLESQFILGLLKLVSNETHQKIKKELRTGSITARILTDLPSKADSSNVIGREGDLDKLWKTLSDSHNNHVILTGFGGIGKTELAKMLFHTYEKEFDEMAWINYQGSLKKSFLASITSNTLQTEGDEDKRWNYMANTLINDGKKKLFIIDNVDHVEKQHPEQDSLLYKLTSWRNTTILLTSRLEWLEGYHSFSLDYLKSEDCVKVFNQYYPREEKPDQKVVADLVELAIRHTLTIELLAKGAWQYDDIKEYYEIVKKGFDQVDVKVTTKYREKEDKRIEDTIEGHLQFLFNLKNLELKDKKVLYSFSILPVNCECTKCELEQWFGLKKADCFSVIQNHWLKYNEEKKTYSLHPLLRTIIRFDFAEDIEKKRNIAPKGTADKILEYLLNHKELFKIEQGYVSLQRIMGIAESVICSVVNEENYRFAMLYRYLGLGYHEISDYKKALNYFFKALDMKKRIGKDPVLTAKLYNDVGRTYWYVGDFQKALKCHFKALEIDKNHGKDSVFTAKVYNDIGVTYWYVGDFQEALKHHNKALEMRKQIPGLEKTDIANSYNNIGLVYNDLKDYTKAMMFYRKALKIDEQILGTDHIGVASDYNNIGLVFENINNYKKASKYHFKALRIHKKYLGEFHSSTATSYHNISSIYRKEKHLEEALYYGFKALNIWTIVLGETHSHVASAYYTIGATYRQQINYNEALKYYEMALSIRNKVLNLNHPDIAEIYNDIGFVFYDQGKYKVSTEHYSKALAIFEEALKQEYSDISTFYNTIGLLYYKLNNNNKMLEYYRKAIAIIEKISCVEHAEVSISSYNIGLMYCEQSNFDKALEYCFKDLSLKENICGIMHPSFAISCIIIGIIYKEKGDHNKALEYYQKAYQIFNKVLGAEHPNTKKAFKYLDELK